MTVFFSHLLLAVLLAASSAFARLQVDLTSLKVRDSKGHEQIDSGTQAYTAQAGDCSSATWADKLVVAARFEEDVSWMATYLTPYMPYLVYSISGDPFATHRTMSNTGREAHAYLQFIVDYYDCMPQYVAFVHGHHHSPHSTDIVSLLKRLKWTQIPGYINLSNPPCHKSTFYFENPDLHKPGEESDAETAKWSQFAYEQNINIQAAWQHLFQEELGDIPAILQSPGCGQFAVTRDAVLAHPKSFYEKSLQWLRSTSMDTFWAGLVFEHTWSYVMGLGANYTIPAPCDYFVCNSEGQAITPAWNEADMNLNPKMMQLGAKRAEIRKADRKAERRRVLAKGRKMGSVRLIHPERGVPAFDQLG